MNESNVSEFINSLLSIFTDFTGKPSAIKS